MNPTSLAVAVLASFRLTRVAVADTILDTPRTWLAAHSNVAAGVLSCSWCSGWWLSGAVTAIAVWCGLLPRDRRSLLAWPAIAGGQSLLSVTVEH